jgi:predicted CxxxxCH...CXXCH cytochrome family protein
VKATFAGSCASCHSAGGAIGGLDLATDPHAAVVDAPSAGSPGEVLVAPGDPEGSLLFRKIAGTQADGEGSPMPPPSGLDPAVVEVFRAWITDGATDACDGGATPTGGGEGVHPDGWAAPDVHGLATKLQTFADCRACHGEELEGTELSAGIGCDDCHAAGWQTTCTFCHGGELDPTGAPPEDIDDATGEISFPAHPKHVGETIHAAWDCTECHAKPTSALTPGHLFDDDSPAAAEVVFDGGLSAGGAYDGNGGCSNLYCHGDGRRNGAVTASATRTCHLCHPDRTSGEGALEGMSGDHEDHVDEGVACAECHPDVVSLQDTIVAPERHVDGAVAVRLPQGMTQVGSTCTGTCHGEAHDGRNW